MQKDISNWDPYGYPITGIMHEYRLEAKAVPSWFEDWSSQTWQPPPLPPPPDLSDQFSDQGANDPEASRPPEEAYENGKFYPSRLLLSCFRLWAAERAPTVVSMGDKTFFNKLAKLAAPDKLVPKTLGGHTAGYVVKA